MRFFTTFHRINQTATTMFRASREEEFHDMEPHGGIPSQLRMAEARVDVIDNDVTLAALFDSIGKFAARKDLEEFRDLISASDQRDNSIRI